MSTEFLIYKTIYLFDFVISNSKNMAKSLEIVGLVLVAIMSLAFVGVIPQVDAGLSPVFWGCAGGALMIIFYRKWKKKQDEINS